MPDGVRALWSRGDGNFVSGVFTAPMIRAGQGAGVEAWISLPSTAIAWQSQMVGFVAWPDSITGDLAIGRPALLDANHRCISDLTLTRDSLPVISLYTGTDATVLVESNMDLISGRWQRFVVQIFPDGSCGFAVNERPLWRSRPGIPTDVPLRIVLSGSSKNTQTLVGPVTAWEGIRDGIQWDSSEGRQ